MSKQNLCINKQLGSKLHSTVILLHIAVCCAYVIFSPFLEYGLKVGMLIVLKMQSYYTLCDFSLKDLLVIEQHEQNEPEKKILSSLFFLQQRRQTGRVI